MKKGYSQPRNRIADQIDFNDVAHILQVTQSPIIECIPAPISVWKNGPHKGEDKMNPHASLFRHANGKATYLFHMKPIYYLHNNGGWRPMSEVASYYGNKNLVLKRDWEKMMDLRFLVTLLETIPNVKIPSPLGIGDIGVSSHNILGKAQMLFTVSTFYPATASGGDASIERITPGASEPSTGGEDWSVISAGNGTNVNVGASDATLHNRYFTLQTAGKWYILGRSYFQIDTSALGDSDTISATTFSLYITIKSDTDGCFGDMGIAGSNPASTTAYATSDFQTAGSTIFSDYINYDSSLPTGQYNVFTFNADGRAAVSKTGFTKLSFQMKEDITGSAPTHSYSGGHNNDIGLSAADTTGTSQDPLLSVTVPDPFVGKIIIM